MPWLPAEPLWSGRDVRGVPAWAMAPLVSPCPRPQCHWPCMGSRPSPPAVQDLPLGLMDDIYEFVKNFSMRIDEVEEVR